MTNLLIVGAGNGGKTLFELFITDPAINIVCGVDIHAKAPVYLYAKSLNLPISSDFRDLFNQPLDLVINVAGNSTLQGNLVKVRLDKTEIIGGV